MSNLQTARELVLEALDSELDDDGGEVAQDGDPQATPAQRAAELSQAQQEWARKHELSFPAGAGSIPQARLRELVGIRLSESEISAYHDARAQLAEISEELGAVARGAAKQRLSDARSILAGGKLDLEALADVEPLATSRARDQIRRSALKSAARAVDSAASMALAGVAKRAAHALEKVIEVQVAAEVQTAASFGLRHTPSGVIGALRSALEDVSRYVESGRAPLDWVAQIVDPSELAQ